LLTLLKVYELLDQLLHSIASCRRRLRCSGVIGGGHGGCKLVGAAEQRTSVAHKGRGDLGEVRFLAVSSGFGDQVCVVPAWRVDEGVRVSLAA
jgi:hypothetical protein